MWLVEFLEIMNEAFIDEISKTLIDSEFISGLFTCDSKTIRLRYEGNIKKIKEQRGECSTGLHSKIFTYTSKTTRV